MITCFTTSQCPARLTRTYCSVLKNAALFGFILYSLTTAAHAEHLRFGTIKGSANLFQSLPILVAVQKKFFEQEGLTVELIPLAGTTQMVDELDKGTIDLSYTATPYLVSAALKGSDAVAVVGGPATTIYSIVSKPAVKNFDDLRGKTIALSRPEDIISISALDLLAKKGIDRSNFAVKELIGTPQRSECLAAGDCAAAALSQPDDFKYQAKGFNILATSSEVLPKLQFTVIAARRSWAEQHKDIVVRFAKAMGHAYRYVGDPKNKEEIIKLGASVTQSTEDISRKTYSLYYEPYSGVLPKQGEISLQGFQKVIELMDGAGTLNQPLPNAERFIDLQFLQAAGLQ
jgi:ABC-type nitrate/sulfonate/bicarbonate transport system substrate-binding protein